MLFNFTLRLTVSFLLLAGDPVVFEGELADGDAVHAERESRMDKYEFETGQQQLLTVALRPLDTKWDTYLELTGPSAQAYQNDDAPDGLGGSMLQFVTPEDGVWEATVSGYGKDVQGKYAMNVNIKDLKKVLIQRGKLTDDDQILLKNGERADVVDFAVVEGEVYVIQMISGAFNSYLSVHVDGKVISNSGTDGLHQGSQVIFTANENAKAKIVLTSACL